MALSITSRKVGDREFAIEVVNNKYYLMFLWQKFTINSKKKLTLRYSFFNKTIKKENKHKYCIELKKHDTGSKYNIHGINS